MPHFDVSQFERFRPKSEARYTIGSCVLKPGARPVVFTMRPGGRANPAYFNAIAKVRIEESPDRVANATAQARAVAGLFARYVATGWENVYGADGQPELFSAAACQELLEHLIDHGCEDWLTPMFMFAADLDNFRAPSPDPVEVGNESRPG